MTDTRPEQVANYLRARRPQAYCDTCITREVGLARPQQAQQATSALAAAGTFKRATGVSELCGTSRLVTRAA